MMYPSGRRPRIEMRPRRQQRCGPTTTIGTMGRPGIGSMMILMIILSSNGNNNYQGPTIQLDTNHTTLGLYTPGEATIIPPVSPQQQLTMNNRHQEVIHATTSKPNGDPNTIECDICSPPLHQADTRLASTAPEKHLQPAAATMVQKAAILQEGDPIPPIIAHNIANAPRSNKHECKCSHTKDMQLRQVEYHYEDKSIKVYIPEHNRVHPSLKKLNKSDQRSPPDVQQLHDSGLKVHRQQGYIPVATTGRQNTPEVRQPSVEVTEPIPECNDPRAHHHGRPQRVSSITRTQVNHDEPIPAPGSTTAAAQNTWPPRSREHLLAQDGCPTQLMIPRWSATKRLIRLNTATSNIY